MLIADFFFHNLARDTPVSILETIKRISTTQLNAQKHSQNHSLTQQKYDKNCFWLLYPPQAGTNWTNAYMLDKPCYGNKCQAN